MVVTIKYLKERRSKVRRSKTSIFLYIKFNYMYLNDSPGINLNYLPNSSLYWCQNSKFLSNSPVFC